MYGNYPTGAGEAGLGLFVLMCSGLLLIIGLAMLVLNIWMLVDALGRQEYEFPGSTGDSKNLWVILLIVGIVIGLGTGIGWIMGIVYYFMVFKKLKRGSVAPQWAQPGAQVPPGYAPPAPPAYTPPAPPAYSPVPPAPPAPPVPPAPPSQPPMTPPAPPAE